MDFDMQRRTLEQGTSGLSSPEQVPDFKRAKADDDLDGAAPSVADPFQPFQRQPLSKVPLISSGDRSLAASQDLAVMSFWRS